VAVAAHRRGTGRSGPTTQGAVRLRKKRTGEFRQGYPLPLPEGCCCQFFHLETELAFGWGGPGLGLLGLGHGHGPGGQVS
jgi:hypothetical protein